jgi:hypothetical protein
MAEADLPFIDVHSVVVDALPDVVWRALMVELPKSLTNPAWQLTSRVLGCADTGASGAPATVGATFPGFRVARTEPPTCWALEGRHRFSRYALTFRVRPLDGGRTGLSAETRAAFPGLLGVLYRTGVIGSSGHGFAVRHLLQGVQRSSEAAAQNGAHLVS